MSSQPNFETSTHPSTSKRDFRSASYSARPSTSRPTTSTSRYTQDFVAAVVESRGVENEVGMCFIDINTSEIVLSQIADSQTYTKTIHKLNLYDPFEILVPVISWEPDKTKLCKIMTESMPFAVIKPIARKYFSHATGLRYIRVYSLKENLSSLEHDISTKYLCLAATAAAIQYVESVQDIVFSNHSLKFNFQGCEGTMLIDTTTVRNLELISNLNAKMSQHSLLRVLDQTRTPMGTRLLRINLLQPLVDTVVINARLDAVEELACVEQRFRATQNGLRGFHDVDRLITHLIRVPKNPTLKHAEENLNSILVLKHMLKMIYSLRRAFVGCRSTMLVAICQILSDHRLEEFERLISAVINEEVTFQKNAKDIRNQRCYAVKSGANGFLDIARQTYKDNTNELYEMANRYSDEFKLPIKVNFNPNSGFFLSTSTESLKNRELPKIFINVKKKRCSLEFTTMDLV
ncbi:uncharacterized protein VTP21DRAFT_10587 [Calcarisporiella thermophila]|uniref:uncharacterized protein n=1 Tax=Calcarisporiella thermophila TaxID=911321 RepID=UPI00374454FF